MSTFSSSIGGRLTQATITVRAMMIIMMMMIMMRESRREKNLPDFNGTQFVHFGQCSFFFLPLEAYMRKFWI